MPDLGDTLEPTPRLDALIRELQATPDRAAHPARYRKYDSTLLE